MQQSGPCQPGGLCTFRLMFVNRGPGEWTGQPELADTLPPGATLVRSSVGCTQNGQTINCRYPRTITLPPNAPGFANITLRMPANLRPGMQNCVDLAPAIAAQDPNPGNNRHCIPVQVAPPPAPDLGVTKVQTSAHCKAGGECGFDLHLVNYGPGRYNGQIQLSDSLPQGASLLSASAPWTCRQLGATLDCSHPGKGLNPGKAVKLSVSLQLPSGMQPGALNCVRAKRPAGQRDDTPANDEQCVPVNLESPPPPPPGNSDTGVEKSQVGSCAPGGECIFELKFSNRGSTDWRGMPKLTDLLPAAGIGLGSAAPSTWNCASAGTAVTCEHSETLIPPGGSISLMLRLHLPTSIGQGMVNCAIIETSSHGPADVNPNNDRHCVPLSITPAGFTPKPPTPVQPAHTPAVTGPACPQGTTLREGVCVRPQSCPEGTHKYGDRCIRCPKGTTFDSGSGDCKKPQSASCPKGTYWSKNLRKCAVKETTIRCPRGTHYDRRYGDCVENYSRPPPVAQCPFGTIPVGNLCIRINLGPGQGPSGTPHSHGGGCSGGGCR